eukprot:TRINITY_DN10376_c0_g2_i1.p1 TRINITY_DN10376_c0_g2~~TRINITY_DN10376_c0_g2_i1.p1  ORF type:complete len:949 (+),score=326.71 TRINITY_DN10376_c0_g2_i1:172-3018(+)
MPGLTSAGGALALLHEDDVAVKGFAVKKLLDIVDDFWAEIADDVPEIEQLYEEKTFPEREQAALLASKVYFHLGELDDALSFAMGAGSQFNLAEKSLYVHTLVAEAIDKYSQLRRDGKEADVSAALNHVVDGMFRQCLSDGQLTQAVGVSLEGRRLDIIQAALAHASSDAALLEYTYNAAMTLVDNRAFRDQVLTVLAEAYGSIAPEHYFQRARCYVALEEADRLGEMLRGLLQQDGKARLLGYQLCFELHATCSQQLANNVRSNLKPAAAADGTSSGMDTGSDDASAALSTADRILSGSVTLGLQVDFLSHNNHSDVLLLNNTKDAIKNSTVLHNAVVLANMIMSAGTTSDAFLRDNKEWLGKASNWAKYSVVGSLGVIHKGHIAQSSTVLKPYLPDEGGATSPYEVAGGLYAMGLVHAGHGAQVVPKMTSYLTSATSEEVQHGAAMGLGLAAMGCQDTEAQDALKNTLAMDSAIAGEAAGLAMGLNMLGTADSDSFEHMFSYAQETQHEKIIRGLSLGMAFLLQGRQEQADAMVARLTAHTDPIIRAGGCHALATAYAGTGNNTIVRKLLHIAVSDASDDVRRAAATAIGFVMLRQPEQVPTLLALLSESFNPHVRAGCCMALGVACAGTGLVQALGLLEPMYKDSTPFVRQAAFVASAMVLLQSPNSHVKLNAFKETLVKYIAEPHQPLLSRFGAIMAQGILCAGGMNTTIRPCPSHGYVDNAALVGLLVFCQFWFWFPHSHFLSLALKPTALICLNGNLKMPQIDIRSDAPPSKYAYMAKTEPPKEKNKAKVATAVLSITDKANKAKAKKDKDSMDTNDDADKPDQPDKADQPETPAEKDDAEEAPKPKEPEPTFELLANPARVVPAQLSVISIPDDCRYKPVAELRGDVIVLADSTPGEDEIILDLTPHGPEGAAQQDAAAESGEDDLKLPEPFTFKPELEGE